LASYVINLPLSVLDLAPVAAGTTSGQALRQAVSAICADSDERARWLAGPAALSFVQLRAGLPQPLASPQEAAAYPYTDQERQFARQRSAGQAIGSPETVSRELTGLIDRTGADELMLTALVYDIEDRIRSFEMIAGKVAGGLRAPA
jgi:alkanesulfonate monooxygenase SsuD/methylene tetrahydromethanopterin reductase-like flavin-dependent oxidoreductase (luciferase family)